MLLGLNRDASDLVLTLPYDDDFLMVSLRQVQFAHVLDLLRYLEYLLTTSIFPASLLPQPSVLQVRLVLPPLCLS